MGTWGSGPVDNDDASDWVYDLAEASDFEIVRRSLGVAHVMYLEAREGSSPLQPPRSSPPQADGLEARVSASGSVGCGGAGAELQRRGARVQ
jgi:hypothetical protein